MSSDSFGSRDPSLIHRTGLAVALQCSLHCSTHGRRVDLWLREASPFCPKPSPFNQGPAGPQSPLKAATGPHPRLAPPALGGAVPSSPAPGGRAGGAGWGWHWGRARGSYVTGELGRARAGTRRVPGGGAWVEPHLAVLEGTAFPSLQYLPPMALPMCLTPNLQEKF